MPPAQSQEAQGQTNHRSRSGGTVPQTDGGTQGVPIPQNKHPSGVLGISTWPDTYYVRGLRVHPPPPTQASQPNHRCNANPHCPEASLRFSPAFTRSARVLWCGCLGGLGVRQSVRLVEAITSLRDLPTCGSVVCEWGGGRLKTPRAVVLSLSETLPLTSGGGFGHSECASSSLGRLSATRTRSRRRFGTTP